MKALAKVFSAISLVAFSAVVASADPPPPELPDDGSGDRRCDCSDSYCQETGGGSGFRYCCKGTGGGEKCGCTLFVVC